MNPVFSISYLKTNSRLKFLIPRCPSRIKIARRQKNKLSPHHIESDLQAEVENTKIKIINPIGTIKIVEGVEMKIMIMGIEEKIAIKLSK